MSSIRMRDVVDQWSTIVSLKGESDPTATLMERTVERIKSTGVTGLKSEQKSLGPSFIRGMVFRQRRRFLVVETTKAGPMRPYQMLLWTNRNGRLLHINWFLAYRLSLPVRLLAALLRIPILGLAILPWAMMFGLTRNLKARHWDAELDTFDTQDLRLLATVGHSAAVGATEDLLQELGRDTSALDRTTRGFLGLKAQASSDAVERATTA